MALSNISYAGLKTCRYLLKISYIGTKYKGLQRLSRRIEQWGFNDGTIQCALESALNRALLPVYGSRLGSSSRTDAGVHCINSAVHVDLTHPFPNTIYKPHFITNAVNRILALEDHEITLVETRMVPANFHSRINAKWRSYVYRLAVINSSTDAVHKGLDLRAFLPISQINRCHAVNLIDFENVQKCIEMLAGEHDFSSFCTKSKENRDKKMVRNIELELRRCYPLTSFELANESFSRIEFYEIYIKSSSFLYNQVRRTVSALIDVGSGRITLADVEQMLTIRFHRPNRLSMMVPAHGLYLVDVGYNEEDLIIRDNAFLEYSPKCDFSNDFFEDSDCEMDQ